MTKIDDDQQNKVKQVRTIVSEREANLLERGGTVVSKQQTIPLHLYDPRPAKMQLRVSVFAKMKL